MPTITAEHSSDSSRSASSQAHCRSNSTSVVAQFLPSTPVKRQNYRPCNSLASFKFQRGYLDALTEYEDGDGRLLCDTELSEGCRALTIPKSLLCLHWYQQPSPTPNNVIVVVHVLGPGSYRYRYDATCRFCSSVSIRTSEHKPFRRQCCTSVLSISELYTEMSSRQQI